MQHALPMSTPPLPAPNLSSPSAQLIDPPTANDHTRYNIHQADQEGQEAPAVLLHDQQDRFDIVFEEDSWDAALLGGVGLRCHGVLVCRDGRGGRVGEDGAGQARCQSWKRVLVASEDCRDEREVVLEFVEVFGGGGDCFVERVEERGIVWAEGEFGNHVREVEIWLC